MAKLTTRYGILTFSSLRGNDTLCLSPYGTEILLLFLSTFFINLITCTMLLDGDDM